MATPAAKPSLTLVQADDWFNTSIIPKRTASAGLSANRLWKSPRALFSGNTEDPDGLCGDAAAYVFEEFFRHTGGYTTADGFHIGLVLWEGTIGNHMANVMMERTKTAVQKYKWDARKKVLTCVSGKAQYGMADLFSLHMYDLYYKKRSTTLEMWWKSQDTHMGGTVKLGFPYNIDE